MESDRPPPLTGVVIITLPPPDNPSLGKTITAFTLSDSAPHPIHQTPQTHNQEPRSHLPVQLPHNPELRLSFRRLLLGNPRAILGFLGIFLFALILYSSVFSRALQELQGREDEEKPGSFIFPLFPKWGNRAVSGGDVELKLGRFVDFESKGKIVGPFDEGLRDTLGFDFNKVVASSNNAADSSTVLPVRGNVYPDGYVNFLTSLLETLL